MAVLEAIPKYAFGTTFELAEEQELNEKIKQQSPSTSAQASPKPDKSSKMTSGQLEQFVSQAIELGVRHFDCAPLYRTQTIVGKALKRAISGSVPRQQLFITSKLPPNMFCGDRPERSCVNSINELQCSYLDLFLLHAPFATQHNGNDDDIYPTDENGHVLLNDEPGVLENAWRALVELKRKGLTRYIGISNVNQEQLIRLNNIHHVDVVQNEYHIYNQDRDLFDYCEEIDVHFEAYAVFGSPLVGRQLGKPIVFDDPVVNRVKRENCLTMGQTLILWVHHQPLSYVIKCDCVEQLQENLAAALLPQLPIHDLVDLDSINRNIHIYKFTEHVGIEQHREYPFNNLPPERSEPVSEHMLNSDLFTATGEKRQAINYDNCRLHDRLQHFHDINYLHHHHHQHQQQTQPYNPYNGPIPHNIQVQMYEYRALEEARQQQVAARVHYEQYLQFQRNHRQHLESIQQHIRATAAYSTTAAVQPQVQMPPPPPPPLRRLQHQQYIQSHLMPPPPFNFIGQQASTQMPANNNQLPTQLNSPRQEPQSSNTCQQQQQQQTITTPKMNVTCPTPASASHELDLASCELERLQVIDESECGAQSDTSRSSTPTSIISMPSTPLPTDIELIDSIEVQEATEAALALQCNATITKS